MTISSRTPEGFPSLCPLCGAQTPLEFSEPGADAPCPQCGHLLWLATDVVSAIQRWLAEAAATTVRRVTAETTLDELCAEDSLRVVELVMWLEEEYRLSIPDDVATGSWTVGDLLRHIERRIGRFDS